MNKDPLILAADDEEDMLIWTDYVLRTAGYRVRTARNAAEAAAALRRTRPDLILLDIRMPAMGGVMAASMIRETPGMEGIPIVFFSAVPEELVRPQMALVGAAGFIQKPCSPERLVSGICPHLEGATAPLWS